MTSRSASRLIVTSTARRILATEDVFEAAARLRLCFLHRLRTLLLHLLRFGVDFLHDDLVELLIRRALFLQRLLKQPGGGGVAELLGQCPGRAIGGDLIVL